MSAAEKLATMPTITAAAFEGITVKDAAGRPASLAVIGADGQVLAIGPEVAAAAWEASVRAYRNYLMGTGHLRVMEQPGQP